MQIEKSNVEKAEKREEILSREKEREISELNSHLKLIQHKLQLCEERMNREEASNRQREEDLRKQNKQALDSEREQKERMEEK